MARLSSPIENIKDHYTVVVIGSGYGGGTAASRLARAGQQVCVLERGKEFQPGEYPDTEAEALAEMQTDTPGGHVGSRTGLYDFRVNDEINVLMGCGLGGTSLINANVSLRAEPRVFDDPRWPQALRDDLGTLLADGYKRAEEMLKPTPYPDNFPTLPKLQALEKSAAYMNEKFYRLPINVTFKDGVNHVGVQQYTCKLCGDCVSGCNYSAKNTILLNYLPDAKNHGAEIYTQVSVQYLERKDDRWLVHYQLLDSGREGFDAPTMFVSADIVILAASSLGSTEILLRSNANGLPLSEQLGHRFTGNSDMTGFAYNTDQPINSVGFGNRAPGEMEPVGPCITGVIDIREQPQLDNGIVIEEGVAPGALSAFLPAGLDAATKLFGKDTDSGVGDYVREKKRELESLLRGAYHGAVKNTQIYLVMGHDDGGGRMYLKDDRLRIKWPDVGKQPIFEQINNRLEQATRALGGTYVKNPIWSELTNHGVITVHPLGGCCMAEDAEHGVVNHKGQVFSGSQGTEVYDTLYVCDGSIMPRSVGANPLLTISALAERSCALLAKDHGWQINYDLPSKPLAAPEPLRLGIQFTETMKGYFSTNVTDDYEKAATQGKSDHSPLEFVLTIISDDLDKMLTDQNHKARMIGTVTAPALSADALTVTDGQFNLFIKNPNQVNTRQMRYRMKMTSEEGKHYYFDGFKVIRDDPGIDVRSDTTTLYITVHDGDRPESPVLGKGILRIHPDDFRRQLTTMQVKNADSLKARLGAIARFRDFFGGTLFDIYGGVFAKSNVFAPDAPPRKKRPLRVDAPQVHFFNTSDGVQLCLTRYQGGSKGPVMLAHGLGVSSLIFSIDTIETNLLEYLYAHGYDVWLLDYRASIDLPAAKMRSTADDVATKDYPAAVAKIRALTGANDIQVVAHCYGSTTFFMAMLAGLEGVRSAVCSQIATHIVAPTTTRVKSGLHLSSILDALGVDSLTAYVDGHADWWERLYDKALSVLPIQEEERCNSPVCHRITFMYSLLYEHDQLNAATHNVLHELFGVANIGAFEHLALLTRRGHLVTANNQDAYLPHLERLAIPIAFIHGGENDCFLPKSTEITYDLLREKNGKGLYSRHVIPNYGHIDCIFGKNAAHDVYPFILHHLEETA